MSNNELITLISDPIQLPTACAVCSWVEAKKVNPRAPDRALELLSNQENLAAALLIRDALVDLQVLAFKKFWLNVEGLIKEALGQAACRGWTVKLEFSVSDSYITIVPSADVELNSMFQVCAENLAAAVGKEAAFFGVWKSELVNAHDAELETALRREHFKSNKVWTGWKWFTSCALPDFTATHENLIRVNADNHTVDRPLAKEVAQTLFQLFKLHRSRLEVLNRRVAKISF